MPTPEPPFLDDRCDLDPPPKGSPALLGDRLASLKSYRRTAEFRSPSPAGRVLRRNILIVTAVMKLDYSQREVAEVFRLTESRVSHILREMETLVHSVNSPH